MNQTCRYRKIKLNVEKYVKIERYLTFSDYQVSDARIKNSEFQFEWSKNDKKFQIDTLNQDITSAVMENYVLEYQENEKTESIWPALSNYQNCTANKKIIGFQN